ncbi:MAG: VOC family protein [Parvularculaceae bacterium]|nr:VOC family protein [Parvularculaceae bacterium]
MTMKHALLIVIAVALASCARAADEGNPAMTEKNNKIDYVEFAASDLGAFKKFYGAAFGWTFQDWGPDYASFEGAGIDGGVRGGETPAKGSTTVILYADDLEATEKAVVAAGGVVTARHEFPGGRRFHFTDTTGNDLAVWTKAGEPQ